MKSLIFHTGALGDTLAAIPALKAVRKHMGPVPITMLTERHGNPLTVSAQSVLEGAGLIDEFIYYPVSPKTRGLFTALRDMGSKTNLIKTLRSKNFDTLFYLISLERKESSIKRDLVFFRMAGIKRVIGDSLVTTLPSRKIRGGLPTLPHQTDDLLSRLKAAGLEVPSGAEIDFSLSINDRERNSLEKWIQTLPKSGSRPLVAICPGSKMPAKRWPIDRYEEVTNLLIEKHDVWPIVFGGPEDQSLGQYLIEKWRRGWVAAGSLDVRGSVAAMEKCSFYMGNDSGPMHMAVAAGIPCVAIFSSRDYPGRWYPYGQGHYVFRANVECEGCMLQECKREKMKCIMSINAGAVYSAAVELLEKSHKNFSYEVD